MVVSRTNLFAGIPAHVSTSVTASKAVDVGNARFDLRSDATNLTPVGQKKPLVAEEIFAGEMVFGTARCTPIASEIEPFGRPATAPHRVHGR